VTYNDAKLQQSLRDTVLSLRGYSRWEGNNSVERELINAIKVAVARAAEAIGEKVDAVGTPMEKNRP